MIRACSVVSDSLWPHGLQPARLLCPWNFPGKNTGVNCHFLLQGIFLTQESDLRLLHWQVNFLPAEPLGTDLVTFTPHSSTLAWKIPWMEEPGRLQSMGSLRVGHDWATSLSLFTFMHWRRKWQPTPVFLPGESQGWGSLLGCHLWGLMYLWASGILHTEGLFLKFAKSFFVMHRLGFNSGRKIRVQTWLCMGPRLQITGFGDLRLSVWWFD